MFFSSNSKKKISSPTTRSLIDHVCTLFNNKVGENVTINDDETEFELTLQYPDDSISYDRVVYHLLRHEMIKDVIISANAVPRGLKIRVRTDERDQALEKSRAPKRNDRRVKRFAAPLISIPKTDCPQATQRELGWVESINGSLLTNLVTEYYTQKVTKSHDEVTRSDVITFVAFMTEEFSAFDLARVHDRSFHDLRVESCPDGSDKMRIVATFYGSLKRKIVNDDDEAPSSKRSFSS